MLYFNQCREQAHREVEEIFRTFLPERGLAVREEQIRLCHEMLSTLLEGKIALCDAGVGIGKTYAYLVAGILIKKHAFGRFSRSGGSLVVSTSSIALQRAVMEEYIPFLSGVMLEKGIIQSPIKGIVRKGKEHFVCDRRLALRLEAVKDKKKNEKQGEALDSLRLHYDMDRVQSLSGFDRRLVSVPGFCPKDCPAGHFCRYRKYMRRAVQEDIAFQICNHNYLLADALHRERGSRPLLMDYEALIVDEAHQLPEVARQMYGMNLCWDDVLEIEHYLEREHRKIEAKGLEQSYARLLASLKEVRDKNGTDRGVITYPEECVPILKETSSYFAKTALKLKSGVPVWILKRLEKAIEVLAMFERQDRSKILYLQEDSKGNPVFCVTSGEMPERLYKTLWEKNFPAILTSGTLKAGNGFEHIRRSAGLIGPRPVKECVAESPFAYDENCLLYLPDTLKECRPERGRNDCQTHSVAGPLNLRAYVGIVHILFPDGKCVPDTPGEHAFPDDGGMASCPGGNSRV
jgi:ATP-dependent DNA helicase DinG